jgi:hypothetical protein
MTAVWGPLGWMTLHSVSTLYPEQPTQAEKTLMTTWLDMFRDTITCNYCRGHFTEMLASYKQHFPNLLNSRHDFVIAVFRMHNAVNRRLSKPIYDTVDKCMETLHNNIKTKSAKDYRFAYVNHIHRYWRSMQDVTGITALKKIQQMRKIEDDYFTPRDTNFQIRIASDVVVLPSDVLEKQEPKSSILPPRRRFVPPVQTQSAPTSTPLRSMPLAGLRMQGGVFQIGRAHV